MAYINKYYLLRVKLVCETYQLHKSRGATTEWIYRNVIRPRFNISRSTMYEYLAIPYATLLRQYDSSNFD